MAQTSDVEEAMRLLSAQEQAVETAKQPKNVEPVTTIDLDVTTERGTRYQGRFYFKVPTLQDQIKIGQLKAMLMPSGTPDPSAATLVEVLSYLQVAIRFSDKFPRPDWWQPMGEMYDDDPFLELYGRCREHENAFRGRDAQRRADDAQPRSEGGPGGVGEAPVGRKVQPPPKRRETLAGDDEGGA